MDAEDRIFFIFLLLFKVSSVFVSGFRSFIFFLWFRCHLLI